MTSAPVLAAASSSGAATVVAPAVLPATLAATLVATLEPTSAPSVTLQLIGAAAAPVVQTVTSAAPPAWPKTQVRDGIVLDKWPFRLDVSTEYQDWILVFVSIVLVTMWCLPCLCGKMRNPAARKFTQCIYTRLNIYFWTITYVNLVILMLTIGILPDWTVNEYLQHLLLFITWCLTHLKKMITSAAIVVGFFLIYRFKERISMAAGLEHITVVHFNWREWLGFQMKKRPVELFVWKVEDLQSSSGKIYKPNDIFVECHLGDNEPMRTRVHNNAGTSCLIKESFQMNINESESGTLMTLLVKDQALMVSTELARLMLSTREICGIEDQTGKRKVEFKYSEESFVALSLLPRGKIWIAIAPVEDMDEERFPLMRDDDLIQC